MWHGWGDLEYERMRSRVLQPDPAGELSLNVRWQFWTDRLNSACFPAKALGKGGDEWELNDHYGM